MATAKPETKARGTMLIRADRSVSGEVSFYDARQEDAKKAFIGRVRLTEVKGMDKVKDLPDHVAKAAIHGYTQNLLDSSNKLEGDARVEFIRKGCETLMGGGWVSAPADDAKVRENAINGLVKAGFTIEAATAIVDRKPA